MTRASGRERTSRNPPTEMHAATQPSPGEDLSDTMDMKRCYGTCFLSKTHPYFGSNEFKETLFRLAQPSASFISDFTDKDSAGNQCYRDMLAEWALVHPATEPFRFASS